MIPVFRPSFGEEELEALREPLRSGWVATGPKTAELERRFAELIGAPQAVALQSCTAALYLAMRVSGVEGAEVVTTPMTFVATNHAILAAGGIPVFADIEPETLTIDPLEVERCITPRTRAVMVMHYAGHPARLAELVQLTQDRGLTLVEDCAHAAGSAYGGRKVGTFGAYGCFSFQAIKNLSSGDGGMITLADADVAARLRRLSWLGIDRGSWERSRGGHGWEFDVTELSLKYQMNDLAAAIGLVQLGKLEHTNARRRHLAERYTAAFAGMEGIEPPIERPEVRSAWHCYVVKLARPQWRDRLVDFLAERGIGATVHYVPNHLFRIYAPYRRTLPVAEAIWQRILTLPLYPDLSDAEQDQVIGAVADFLGRV